MDNGELIWSLIARCLSHEATEEEHQELASYLEQQPEIAAQYMMLEKLWHKERGSNDNRPGGCTRGAD